MNVTFKTNLYFACKVILILLFTSRYCCAQTIHPGVLKNLTLCSSFKSLALGAEISTINADKLSYLDDNLELDRDSCMLYQYHDTTALKQNAEFKIQSIAIRTYKNKIVNIYMFFYRSDGYKILQSFLNKYGQFTDRATDYADVYNWKTKQVTLSLKFQLHIEFGIAIFTDAVLFNEIEERNKSITRLRQLLISGNY
jgi:hypothetical protein